MRKVDLLLKQNIKIDWEMKIFRVYLPVQRKEETFYRTSVSLWGQEYGFAIILHRLVYALE